MLKTSITSLALAAAFGAVTLATDIIPIPVAIAQQAPSSGGPAFDAGVAGRRTWEEWFASLTGDFKKGAEYWAGQRSFADPGSCYAPDGSSTGDWTQGCLAAQSKLAASDVRRKAEPDYRKGWNSYAGSTSQPVSGLPGASTAGQTPTQTAPTIAPAREADVATRFIPLNEFMNGLGNTPDPPSYGYVAERCAALYGLYGKDLADETDPQKKRASEISLNKAEKLIDAALKFNSMGTTQDLTTIGTNTTKYVVGLGKIYTERIYQARLHTGNAFDDPLVASDMATCRVVSDMLSAAEK